MIKRKVLRDQYYFFFSLIILLIFIAAIMPAATALPVINDISPSSGKYGTTITITITGSGLDTVSQVIMYRCGQKYGTSAGMTASITKQSATSITAKLTPSGSVVNGYYDAILYNPGSPVVRQEAFTVYGAPGEDTWTPTTTTPVATTRTTTVATTTTSPGVSKTTASTGDNSVFFESNPSGATISLSGNVIGTTPFTYYTDKDGTFGVLARKDGFENFEGTVTIREGMRSRFYALLTPLTGTSANSTATVNSTESGDAASPGSGNATSSVTTIRKSTLKIPTPLGTDYLTETEESPVSPAIALVAAGIAIGLVLVRRR